MVRAGVPRLCAAAFATAAIALGACSDDDRDEPMPRPGDEVGAEQPFPDPTARTLAELRDGLGPGPRMASSVSVLEPGRKNRFAFGLFDRARRQIGGAPAAVYVAPVDGGEVEGPYPRGTARSRWTSATAATPSSTTTTPPTRSTSPTSRSRARVATRCSA